MADSTVPGAIAALVTMFTAALPTVQVFDSDVTGDVQAEYVGVAFPDANDPTDNSGVTGRQDWADLGGLSKSEAYDIRCELSTWSGGDTLTARRVRAFAMFKALQDALRLDPGLAASLSPSGNASVGDFDLATGDSPQGPLARIQFTVEVRNVHI